MQKNRKNPNATVPIDLPRPKGGGVKLLSTPPLSGLQGDGAFLQVKSPPNPQNELMDKGRHADAIEITPEMISAGVDAFLLASPTAAEAVLADYMKLTDLVNLIISAALRSQTSRQGL